MDSTKSSIDTLLVDCDGVLTDGKCTWTTPEKNHLRRLTQRTSEPSGEIVAMGIRVIIVTADDGSINAKYAGEGGELN
ncbi:MAG: hypothetical protein IPJ53_18345 [Saprospiraceae bacterium]|nr:hypothetical protein [Candidatus Vicinibacter affinis]